MLKGNMIGAIIMLPILIYILSKIINLTFKIKIIKESLSFSIPMLPGLFSAWILELSDRIFIERYFNLEDVGIYAMGYKIAGLILVFSSAFNLAYNPVFYKLANSENQLKAKKTLTNYNHVFSIVLISAAFILTFFSKEAIYFLLDSRYYEAYKIVPVIGFAYLVSQMSGLFNLMIYQEKKVIKLMWIGLIGALINLLLNFILIPDFGADGAAIATAISFILIFVLSWRTAKKYYYIPFKWKQLSFILLPLIVIIIIFQYFLNLNIYASLLIKGLVLGIILIILIKKYWKEIITIYKKTSK
jgi:O-antigen/teichoic acid export membrane protein